MPQAKCEACGAKLPRDSKFCPQCGMAVASGDTVVEEVPPAEVAPAPVEPQVAERRFFGVPPSTVLLALTAVGVAVAIALFALGNWPWALIVLGLAGFVGTALFSQARRLPGETSAVTKASVGAVDSVRARARALYETVAARGSARMELAKLRREAGALTSERSERLRELGEAVHEGNDAATKDAKARLDQLDEELRAKETQVAKVTMDAEERIGRARLETQPTQVAEPESKRNIDSE